MSASDRELGMDRSITRRDFLNGVSVAIGATMARPNPVDALELTEAATAPTQAQASDYYPPALTGMRGSHAGSFEVAHGLRDGKQWTPEKTGENYDLVVVGGGLSGLAAAYYFRKAVGPQAKILILDNHDDFGGHAKRNEFKHGDRTVIGYGGTMYIVAWNTYSLEGRMLLQDIGLDPARFYKAIAPDNDLYLRMGLGRGVFFDKETFGTDRLVVGEPLLTPALSGATGGAAPTGSGGLTWAQFLAKCPLSDTVKRDIQRLYEDKSDYMPGLAAGEKIQRLRKISYRQYLLDHVKVDPDCWKYFQARQLGGPNSGGAPDSFSGWSSFRLGFPGFGGLGIGAPPARTFVEKPAEMIHFPDGNAGIARLIVRSLIPKALPGSTMEDAVTSRLNYSELDEPDSPTRIRLNSTVVRAKHTGEPGSAKDVEVTYVRDGKAYRVSADACVMACYNAVIPYLCPELPARQKEALHMAVRKPFVYTNVFIRNWTSFAKLGVSNIHAPGGYHDGVGLDFPVSLGTYRCSRKPEEPIVLHLQRVPLGSGKTARDQFRAGRADLLATPFETFERKIRDELGRMLVDGGFDPARDIEGITVNRWPHGYASGQNSLYDPDWSDEELPWIVGRKRWGRIAIANTDAAAICLTQAAFEQAHRAVSEIVADVIRPQHMYPWVEKM
jgi:spermidine dehydrogenase